MTEEYVSKCCGAKIIKGFCPYAKEKVYFCYECKQPIIEPIPKPKPDNSPTDVNDKAVKVDKPDKGGGG